MLIVTVGLMKTKFHSLIIYKTDGPKALGINLQYLHPEHLRVWHWFFSGISGKLFSEDVLHIRSSLLATRTKEHK